VTQLATGFDLRGIAVEASLLELLKAAGAEL
jgi:hypothetical protein